jgi:2-oxoglutarate ferredoxin oxidoreductase subunit alpha
MTWQIGGVPGEGIDVAGEIFALSLVRSGLNVSTHRSYPSRIRGGYTSYTIRIKEEPVLSYGDDLHLLIAFDQGVVDKGLRDLNEEGTLIYDSASFEAEIAEERRAKLKVVPLPLADLAEEAGRKITRNIVSLGVTAGYLGLDPGKILAVVEERFRVKSEKIVEMNRKAVELGVKEIQEKVGLSEDYRLCVVPGKKKYLLSGGDAVVFGAIAAGSRFYSAYPITPASYILEQLAVLLPEYGGVTVQAEDEIAAVNMAIGANFAGVRGMTATSGPGLSLMTEAITLSGMTEVPVVIVDGQRPGPATGMPTKSEQGDFGHLVFGGHGDFPRIVLTPCTVEEIFHGMIRAFNLAERFQCPVFVAIDHALAVGKESIEGLDFSKVTIDRGELLTEEELEAMKGKYVRFSFTESGVSPRSIPGQKGDVYVVSGDEHTETGHICSEDAENRVKMMDKRLRKYRAILEAVPQPKLTGDPEAQVVLIAVGSARGPTLEAMERFKREGIPLKYLHLECIFPLHFQELEEIVEEHEKVIIIENNATGQLARIFKSEICYHEKILSILKYDGRPFRPEEVYRKVKEVL